MATAHFSRGSLIIKDENLGVNNLQKKDGINGKGKNALGTTKKGGGGLGSRKALNDITNKSVIRQEVATKRNNVTKEEFNVKDERFLHDHTKCEEANWKVGMSSFLDIILPGTAYLKHVDEHTKRQDIETIPESPQCYPEPMEESEPELSYTLNSTVSIGWDSDSDSPPPLPLPWLLEPIEFALKPELESEYQ